jgi:hypothetical protein
MLWLQNELAARSARPIKALPEINEKQNKKPALSKIQITYTNFWGLLKSCDIILSIDVLTRLSILSN